MPAFLPFPAGLILEIRGRLEGLLLRDPRHRRRPLPEGLHLPDPRALR